MRQSEIAAVLARDLLRADDGKQSNAIECFACGRGITYKGSRFCSTRCRQWYDAGNPGHAQDWLRPKIDQYGSTGWKVIAGPPSIEIGSDYYKPIRDAFERRNASKGRNKVVRLRTTGTKIPNYIVRANGHGYWQPSAASRSLGFASVDCGFDGEEARAKARALNEAASNARKQAVVGENTKREAA